MGRRRELRRIGFAHSGWLPLREALLQVQNSPPEEYMHDGGLCGQIYRPDLLVHRTEGDT